MFNAPVSGDSYGYAESRLVLVPICRYRSKLHGFSDQKVDRTLTGPLICKNDEGLDFQSKPFPIRRILGLQADMGDTEGM
jgi:hypothetical protein